MSNPLKVSEIPRTVIPSRIKMHDLPRHKGTTGTLVGAYPAVRGGMIYVCVMDGASPMLSTVHHENRCFDVIREGHFEDEETPVAKVLTRSIAAVKKTPLKGKR